MSAKFQIEKDDTGKFTPESLRVHKEQMGLLPAGKKYEVIVEPSKDRYTATRYKHYFDCVLWQILNEAGQHYRIIDLKTGEERRPRNTQELHDVVMKPTYNKVLIMTPTQSMLVAGSTTELSDREFLRDYLEQIIADHSGPPYLIEFISYEDWKGLHAANAWGNFKKNYKPQT